jgi:hypothetical protein
MKMFKSRLNLIRAAGALCIFSSVAAAQPNDSRSPTRDGNSGFVVALGGASFGTTDPSATYALAGGVKLLAPLQATFELGHLQMFPKSLQEDLDEAVAALNTTPVNVSFQGKWPTRYGSIGLRLSSPSGHLRPYGEFAVGWASVEPNLTYSVDGKDATNEFAGLGFPTGGKRLSKGLLIAGAGLSVRVRRAPEEGVDGVINVGYRHVEMRKTAVPARVHQVIGSIGVTF